MLFNIIWLVVFIFLIIGSITYFVRFKRKSNDDFSFPDLSLWIGLVGAILAVLVFLAATGILPWPSVS